MQGFHRACRGPSPAIPLLIVLTMVLVLNGDGGRRESCCTGGGRGGGFSISIGGLPTVVIAILGIHYFLSVVLPSYQFPAGIEQLGDDEGYGLGTILLFALFLILCNFF